MPPGMDLSIGHLTSPMLLPNHPNLHGDVEPPGTSVPTGRCGLQPGTTFTNIKPGDAHEVFGDVSTPRPVTQSCPARVPTFALSLLAITAWTSPHAVSCGIRACRDPVARAGARLSYGRSVPRQLLFPLPSPAHFLAQQECVLVFKAQGSGFINKRNK